MSKKVILVVDDDQDLREQMVMFLEAKGYSVIAKSCEKEAVSAITSESFDLAVLDLMMENKDSGFVLSHKIKKAKPKTPVIIVTAVTQETGMYFDASTSDEKSWIKADAFIQKELRFEQLEGEIEKLLKA